MDTFFEKMKYNFIEIEISHRKPQRRNVQPFKMKVQ